MQFTDWNKIEAWLKERVPGYESENKKYNAWQRFVGKITFWMDYMNVWTTAYPKVWLPDRPLEEQRLPEVLEHEAVHLLDMQTFFGLMPWMPKRINAFLFQLLYAAPQIFVAFAAFASLNLWWLLFWLFLLPLPSPVRMIAEMRAHRRSAELGVDKEAIVRSMNGWTYFKMWPFKKHLAKLLEKPSPYKEEMDKIRDE